jgi:hypothetical protein
MPPSFRKVNPEALQKAFASEPKGSSDKANWLKLPTGTATLRICPPFADDGIPWRRNVNFQNLKNSEGKDIMPTSFDFIFGNRTLATYLCKTVKKLTQVDFDLWKKHGDPMRKLAEAVQATGRKDDKAKGLWPRTTYLFNILNRQDGKVYKWSQSKKTFEAVELNFLVNPNIFDANAGHDFMITASGDGKARRYTTPVFVSQPSPLNYDGELFNLDEAVAKGVRTYHEVLESMASTPSLQEFIIETKFDIKAFLS